MPEIMLTEAQAQVLASASSTVIIRDANGATVGAIDPREAKIIAEARRRLARPGPRYSSVSVFALLDALQTERNRIGAFDEAYSRDFVRALEAEDPATYGAKVQV